MNQTQQTHILVIDDDREIAGLIQDYLSANDFRVTVAYDGLRLQRLLQQHNFDLIILDVMLPGKNGLLLCQEVRTSLDIPVIMLSAANTESDRVVGLEMGADDYLSKPFGSRELLARVNAQLRRSKGLLPTSQQRLANLQKIRFGCWQLDRESHCLIDQENLVIPLSQREYELLLVFLEHPERILSRDQLMDLVYGRDNDPFDRTIDVQVGRLRKKIEKDPKNPKILVTVRGGGYQLKEKVEHVKCD